MLDLLFPPTCHVCSEPSKEKICEGCAPFFEMNLPKVDRSLGFPTAAPLGHQEAVRDFLRRLKEGRSPFLAKTGGSFLLLHFEKLKWPLPDLIVPIPRPWFRPINQSRLLAKELGKLLGVPVVRGLKYVWDEPSAPKRFEAKKKSLLLEKTLLVIDDVCKTGRTLGAAHQALRDAFPKKVYGLTLAKI